MPRIQKRDFGVTVIMYNPIVNEAGEPLYEPTTYLLPKSIKGCPQSTLCHASLVLDHTKHTKAIMHQSLRTLVIACQCFQCFRLSRETAHLFRVANWRSGLFISFHCVPFWREHSSSADLSGGRVPRCLRARVQSLGSSRSTVSQQRLFDCEWLSTLNLLNCIYM